MSSCVDSEAHCATWANMGYCQNNRYAHYMTRECKKSCNICANPTVKKDLKLRLLVKIYFFLLQGISSKPCFDKNRQIGRCQWWTSQNFCTDEKYQEYMTENCAKSCNKC